MRSRRAGNYTATVTVSDATGQTATGTVQVSVTTGGNPNDDTDGDGEPNGNDDDDDNDGVSDENEANDGTDPLSPGSMKKTPFTLLKLGGSVKFNASGKDSCSVSGTFDAMPAGFSPLGKKVIVDIGGATRMFTLDAKGRAKTIDGAFGLKLKLVTNKTTKVKSFPGGAVPFKVKLSKGSWMDEWSDEGIDPAASASKTPMPMTVDITFGGRVYTSTANAVYSSKAGVGGKFKKYCAARENWDRGGASGSNGLTAYFVRGSLWRSSHRGRGGAAASPAALPHWTSVSAPHSDACCIDIATEF